MITSNRFFAVASLVTIISLFTGWANAAEQPETRQPGRCVTTTELVTDPVTGAQQIKVRKVCEYTESEKKALASK